MTYLGAADDYVACVECGEPDLPENMRRGRCEDCAE